MVCSEARRLLTAASTGASAPAASSWRRTWPACRLRALERAFQPSSWRSSRLAAVAAPPTSPSVLGGLPHQPAR